MPLPFPAVRPVLPLLLVGALFVGACSGDASPPSTPPTTAGATTTAPPTTTTQPPPTTTALPSTRDLYDAVSPALAFVTTDYAVGSGVLLEDGWIVTNAHVVWPFDTVRVVFPDGTEIVDTPVVRVNTYEDLAVLGPVDAAAEPLLLATTASYGVGDTVFLVGYPGEIEDFPTPAITQGVVSRLREWDDVDMTFLQTDALIAGGQSGGALVSEHGEVLGISGLGGFSESNFALVAAADDLAPRIEALIAGETPGRFTFTELDLAEPAIEHTVELPSYWHEGVFVISEPAGTEVSIEVGGTDHAVFVTDALGFSLNTDEGPVTSVAFTTEFAEPHYVFVTSQVPGPNRFTVTSTVPMARWTDTDDDLVVQPGDIVQASLDISGELDVYRISLDEGETVTVRIDGLFDPSVLIDVPGNPDEALAFDDNGGGGLYGTNAEATFTADRAAEYLIIVSDALFEPGAGYTMTVG